MKVSCAMLYSKYPVKNIFRILTSRIDGSQMLTVTTCITSAAKHYSYLLNCSIPVCYVF